MTEEAISVRLDYQQSGSETWIVVVWWRNTSQQSVVT